jgi:hypothetical protein
VAQPLAVLHVSGMITALLCLLLISTCRCGSTHLKYPHACGVPLLPRHVHGRHAQTIGDARLGSTLAEKSFNHSHVPLCTQRMRPTTQARYFLPFHKLSLLFRCHSVRIG